MTQVNNKEHELAVWLNEQEENYHPNISKSKGMLRDPECHKLYTEFINDPKYSKYLTKKSVKKIDRCDGCGRHDDFCRCGDFMAFGEN
tara:strand:+ start:784 stop:1047 length:264 start_codon:yes stop_codon:yes gene_type:complete